nr:MAG TPA: hypothetical protein [Bacteriophage sp.]
MQILSAQYFLFYEFFTKIILKIKLFIFSKNFLENVCKLK